MLPKSASGVVDSFVRVMSLEASMKWWSNVAGTLLLCGCIVLLVLRVIFCNQKRKKRKHRKKRRKKKGGVIDSETAEGIKEDFLQRGRSTRFVRVISLFMIVAMPV